jgi:hypothetical protein
MSLHAVGGPFDADGGEDPSKQIEILRAGRATNVKGNVDRLSEPGLQSKP